MRPYRCILMPWRINTDKVPKSEIKKAQKIRDDFLKRVSLIQLKEVQNEDL